MKRRIGVTCPGKGAADAATAYHTVGRVKARVAWVVFHVKQRPDVTHTARCFTHASLRQSMWLRCTGGHVRIAGMSEDSTPDCFVCRKHLVRGTLVPGGPVAEDELVMVSHVAPPEVLGREGNRAYLGHLLVEPLRHAPGMADLTDPEAQDVGRWCTRASRALRDVAGAEHVYAAVFGDGVPHLHVHLLPRFPGTPREFWGVHVDTWPQARRGKAAEIELLVDDLRSYLAR